MTLPILFIISNNNISNQNNNNSNSKNNNNKNNNNDNNNNSFCKNPFVFTECQQQQIFIDQLAHTEN